MEYYMWLLVAYVLGSAMGFFIGRKVGINIGSVLTFDLFVRLGYVKSSVNADGEVQIEQVAEGRDPYPD